ncbi:MAG TPA: L-aspartate oxidase [Dehalococcoidia bacterium]|nr:L-aspartate oxidase [Dehalococcoidia bacterium]
MQTTYYDYIIVGSGIAGLYTALLAESAGSVLILTKGSIEDCNTRFAQGGIAAAISKNDSPLLHFHDTVSAGVGLCDEKAVKILCDEAQDRIADLIKFGVPFDTVNGEIALTKEAAHSLPRIIHAGGDATGEHIETTLSRKIRQSRVKVLEHCMATTILINNTQIEGITALDLLTGDSNTYKCKFIILATGGAGRLYEYTTNSDVATGDGNALAFEAGAEISDMEFFQFHPTALRLPGVTPFLISEAVRGEGGLLRDIHGKRFMPEYSEDAELAPRDIVARSINYQMKKTNSDHVFIDVRHIAPSIITTRFPHIYSFCLEQGIDITTDLIPVAPAAHFFMGGVRVNTWGETNIAGLFCAGENACTGVHGANRLASNSLLEVVVFGKRIIERTQQKELFKADTESKNQASYHLCKYSKLRNMQPLSVANLRILLWDKVGIIRTGYELEYIAKLLYTWQSSLPQPLDRPTLELNNMLLNARLMTEAALIRQESRGAHFRNDFPTTRDSWQKHIIFRKE